MAYNHAETIGKLPVEHYRENFQWAYDSYNNALCGELVQCRSCWDWFELHELFRCYWCWSYYCVKCAKKHFE